VPFYFPLVNDEITIDTEIARAIGARRGLKIAIIDALLANLLSSADVHPPFEHERS